MTSRNGLVIYDPRGYPSDGFAQLLVHRYRIARNEQEQADAEMALAELGLWVYLTWWPGCVLLNDKFTPQPVGEHVGTTVDRFECVVHGFDCDEPCGVAIHTVTG